MRLTLNVFLKTELSSEDFKTSLAIDKINTLNLLVADIKRSTYIVKIKIWDNHGKILFSDDSRYIGKHYEKMPEDLLNATNNIGSFNITQLDDDEGGDLAKFDEVIEMYEPINLCDTVVGVFEIYRSYDDIEEHINNLRRTIIFIMFLGLLTLYLFLLKIITNASETLISQNNSLSAQKIQIQESYEKLNSTYKNTIVTLSRAVDARDSYTAGHSERVSKISVEIGSTLGFNKNQLENLEISALFHDIGKLGVPDKILFKPDKLTDDEFEKIKEHPQIGVDILKDIDFLKPILPFILHHHEKFSGGGYPSGIKGENIPLEARIIAIADTYDAITSDRLYRKALSHDYARSEIIKYANIQFDPVVVDAFLKVENQLKKGKTFSQPV
jgi:hypothetical protein